LENGLNKVGNVLAPLAPNPVHDYQAASASADTMLDSNQAGLDRAGAAFGFLGNTIMTVIDCIPVVDLVEGAATKAIDKLAQTGAEELAEKAAAESTENAVASCATEHTCFVAGTPVLVRLAAHPHLTASLTPAQSSLSIVVPLAGTWHMDARARQHLGLIMIGLGIYGVYVIRRMGRESQLNKSEKELAEIEPLDMPLCPDGWKHWCLPTGMLCGAAVPLTPARPARP